MSKYDISNSGNGYNSDGTPLNLFVIEALENLWEEITDTFDSLIENFKEDSTEPNPFTMDSAEFINSYFFKSSHKEDIREFFEEIQANKSREA